MSHGKGAGEGGEEEAKFLGTRSMANTNQIRYTRVFLFHLTLETGVHNFY